MISLVVSEQVKENVRKYFEKNLPEYEIVAVVHDDNDRDYLYRVMAKEKQGNKYFPGKFFATWTAWNESIQELNYGNYILTEKKATQILFGISTPIHPDRLDEIATKENSNKMSNA